MNIINIQALEVYDALGFPTVEVNVAVGDEFKQAFGKAIVPSGYFNAGDVAKEARDTDKERFLGKGVKTVITNINTFVAKALYNHDFKSIKELDDYILKLDGTKDKRNIGVNGLLGISVAAAKAFAKFNDQILYEYLGQVYGTRKRQTSIPVPVMTLIEQSDPKASYKEVAIRSIGDYSFRKRMRYLTEMYHLFRERLVDISLLTDFDNQVFTVISEVAESLGFEMGTDIDICIELNKLTENIDTELDKIALGYVSGTLEGLEKKDVVKATRYSVKNAKNKLFDAVRFEANEIGTVTEIFSFIDKLNENSQFAIAGLAEGETEDVFLAHVLATSGCDMVHFSGFRGSEVSTTINELLRIERHEKENKESILLSA